MTHQTHSKEKKHPSEHERYPFWPQSPPGVIPKCESTQIPPRSCPLPGWGPADSSHRPVSPALAPTSAARPILTLLPTLIPSAVELTHVLERSPRSPRDSLWVSVIWIMTPGVSLVSTTTCFEWTLTSSRHFGRGFESLSRGIELVVRFWFFN